MPAGDTLLPMDATHEVLRTTAPICATICHHQECQLMCETLHLLDDLIEHLEKSWPGLAEALRLLDELIERLEKFWPGSAEVAQLETLRRDLMAKKFSR